MYLDADHLPPGTVLQDFDICVVGAGAAGIAIAQRLIGARQKVLLLASGHRTDRGRPAEARQSIYRGTVGPFMQKVDPIFLDRSRLNMYGGTTNHFGFWSRPLDPIDFEARPGYRDAAWPFGLDELVPFYRDAHEFGHFGPFNYEQLDFWEQVLYARCFPSGPDDALVGAVMHAQYEESLHDFQVQFGEALRSAANVTVLFNAHLLHIEASEDRHRVTELRCATVEDGALGRQFTIRAHRYVLAMGGIENVRALKLAGDLGNNSRDHLGRGFMVHPLITNAAHVRFDKPVDLSIRNFFRDQQVRLHATPGIENAYTHISAPLVNPEDVLSYCVFNAWGVLVPSEATLRREQIGNFRLILRFSPAGDEAIVNINWEQVPNENSLIRLDETHCDPIFGQPVAHLDWRMLDVDKETMVRGLKLCEAYLHQHGLTSFAWITDPSGGAEHWSFLPDEGALATGDHHMGALRMSVAPEYGIVDPNSRMHSVDNLYIAGCAAFPTGGFANPTLTIVALALRLADHLKAEG